MTLGLDEAAGVLGERVDVRLAVERNACIASVYFRNFQVAIGTRASPVYKWFDRRPGDLLSVIERRTRALVGPIELLVGGPPCHGHSTLNNHTRAADPKNALYMVI